MGAARSNDPIEPMDLANMRERNCFLRELCYFLIIVGALFHTLLK
jgi:hypothetical protein